MENLNTLNISNTKEIKSFWITGFSDGESSFSVSVSLNVLY